MTESTADLRRAEEEPDPRRWKALTVTLVAGFMSLLDVSIVSVALPSIQRGLGTDAAGVQWVVAGYALTFGLALVPAGRLGDAFGRRRVFLWALGAFVLCSALVGAAPNTGLLIVARLAQLIPSAQVESVAGAGHLMPITHMPWLAEKLAHWLTDPL